MFDVKEKLFGIILLACAGSLSGIAQLGQAWKMQALAIQTPWAKQVNPNNVLPEYPRPQLERDKWINLNGLWNYTITTKGEPAPKQYSGKILVPYPIESALSGVQESLDETEELWYRRTFIKPNISAGEKLLLHFGAVDWQATIFINGKKVGGHEGGYQSFSFDISSVLKPGENELVVQVFDPTDFGIGPHGKQTLTPNNIYYTASSGIWQTVWLETVTREYISGLKITPDIDRSCVKVVVQSGSNLPVKLRAAGSTVMGYANTEIVVPVKNARLWSPDDPYLYDLQVSMGKDVVKSYFGMRKIEVKKDGKGMERIFLNNEYYYNLGTLDQGFWPDGLYTAPTDDALRFDIEAIKAMGFNTIRKHIKVEPARWYYHADKLGILVWQDMVNPDFRMPEGSKAQFKKECNEIISQLYNSPSIVTWVLFNENWGAHDQEQLAAWMKSLDRTRLLNAHSGAAIVKGRYLAAVNGKRIENRSVGSDMTDIHSYPPPSIPHYIPGRARVLGEFGGIAVSVGDHLWSDLNVGFGYGKVVSPTEMKQSYAEMMDSLVIFEKEGLSASIYTQPFDVEAEQNGLMTYDRKYLKLPLNDLWSFNARLWPATKTERKISFEVVPDSLAADYSVKLQRYLDKYNAGARDSLLLLRLAVLAKQQNDKKTAAQASKDYLLAIENPLDKTNLNFMKMFASTGVSHPAFMTLIKYREQASEILGDHSAEYPLIAAIFNDEIKKYVSGDDAHPEWDNLEHAVVSKYGEPGEVILLYSKAIHFLNQKQYVQVAEAMDELHEKYAWYISAYSLNDMGMAFFANVTDQLLLEKIVKWMTPTIEETKAAFVLDTYANLVYKSGQKDEGIKWQKKALGNSSDGLKAELEATLKKMENDLPTWPTNAAAN